jgi:glycine/D-amino acid oxidase-like deaminating enzyme
MHLRTGRPFWIVHNGAPVSYDPLVRDESCDVAVVGTGVTGAAAAYLLATAGANVVVVDRREVASGSTAASTGLLSYETDLSLIDLARRVGIQTALRSYELGRRAVDCIESLCSRIGDACGFARRSSLYLASCEEDAARLRDEQSLRTAHGFATELLTRDQLHERFGLDAVGAIHSGGHGEIDPYRFARHLLRGAVDAGARVYERSAVVDVQRTAEGLALRIDSGAVVRARRVVWAGGYETVDDLATTHTNLNSTWACATAPLQNAAAWPERCLIWETARPYCYLRTTSDGRILLGGEDSPFSRRHESERLLRRKTSTLMKRLGALVPGIRAEPAYSWAGVFGESRDGLPYVGPASDENLWYALGYGGNGITFGIVAACLLRDRWTGKPNRDATLFRFDRPSRS